MRYRTVGSILLLILTVLKLPLLATAQRPGHVPRIALLELGAASAPSPWFEAFRQELRERGWVEGHTITIEWRWAEGNAERFASLVAEMLRLPVEVLVVPNGTMAQMAKQATTTIPIVVVAGGNMLETGLIASLARPGGNVTGLSTMSDELTLLQLELLKEALPGITRVAVLRGLAPYDAIWPTMEAHAQALGMELQRFDVRDPTAFDSAFAAMTAAQSDALFQLGDPFFFPYRAKVAALALQHRLPALSSARAYAEAGYLMSYGASVPDRGQRIASYVDRILKGATPADLPVEQPTKFNLIINLKTAQALGLTLFPMFLFRADEVIK